MFNSPFLTQLNPIEKFDFTQGVISYPPISYSSLTWELDQEPSIHVPHSTISNNYPLSMVFSSEEPDLEDIGPDQETQIVMSILTDLLAVHDQLNLKDRRLNPFTFSNVFASPRVFAADRGVRVRRACEHMFSLGDPYSPPSHFKKAQYLSNNMIHDDFFIFGFASNAFSLEYRTYSRPDDEKYRFGPMYRIRLDVNLVIHKFDFAIINR